MAASARRRRRRMCEAGKMVGAAGADLMKPQRKIRNLVKPRAAESTLKPTSAYSAEEPWFYVRGCRIERAGLRFRVNSQGELYVPDSKDEEEALEVSANGPVDVDLAPVVAADGAAGVDLPPTVGVDAASDIDLPPAVAANRAAGVDLVHAVAADGATSVEMTLEVAASLAKKVLGEDLHPEVAALLAAVLSKMEPFYHECFIDMYKDGYSTQHQNGLYMEIGSKKLIDSRMACIWKSIDAYWSFVGAHVGDQQVQELQYDEAYNFTEG